LKLHRLTSSLHYFTAVNTLEIYAEIALNRAKHICEDDDVFWLYYGNYGNNELFGKLPMEFIA
jgi:hypothetical protein